ncbi:UDP-N-acetylmuramoyl-tripeptide--D-alanyl-D-alanine ligase [Kitasatospora sp. NPDC015120]|uniref:UDP-N-acetylmuramoyl-tripeptide--D-alanyl-D- alanine ligase n=1 Tax=Kitasatospora sp. NPDC015120 TaxID=3364023 RepID=UPI0036F452E3
MLPTSLAQVAVLTGGTLAAVPDPDSTVTGPVAFDSRRVAPGGLFAALPGEHTDGHDHAQQAVLAGALAALTTRPVAGAPCIVVPDVLAALADLARAIAGDFTGITIGITGSAGKTSTKDLLKHVLATAGPTVATEGSFNNELGHPVAVLRTEEDTAFLVLEMGARGKGHIAHLTAIAPPDIACCLPIGRAHLGEFGSRRAIAQAKQEIVENLPPTGTAVLCADDPLVLAMAQHTEAAVLTFGTDPGADVRATDIKLDDRGRPHFTLTHDGASEAVQLAVHGEHHVTNALAAAAIALAAGLDLAAIARVLATATIDSGGRMQPLDRPDGTTIVNDAFNASPESVTAALNALPALAAGRPLLAVLGEMAELGDDSEALHATTGVAVTRSGITHLVTIGEGARLLGEMAAQGGTTTAHADNRDHAHTLITGFLTDIGTPAVVLIKGAHGLNLEHLARTLATAPAL